MLSVQSQSVFKRHEEMLEKDLIEQLLEFAKKQEYQQLNQNLICWWGVSPIGLKRPIENEPLLSELRDYVCPNANSISILKYDQGIRAGDRENQTKTTQVTLIDYNRSKFEEPPTIQMVRDGLAVEELNQGEVTVFAPSIYYGFWNHHDHYEIHLQEVEFNLHQQRLEMIRRIMFLKGSQIENLLELTNKFHT